MNSIVIDTADSGGGVWRIEIEQRNMRFIRPLLKDGKRLLVQVPRHIGRRRRSRG